MALCHWTPIVAHPAQVDRLSSSRDGPQLLDSVTCGRRNDHDATYFEVLLVADVRVGCYVVAIDQRAEFCSSTFRAHRP